MFRYSQIWDSSHGVLRAIPELSGGAARHEMTKAGQPSSEKTGAAHMTLRLQMRIFTVFDKRVWCMFESEIGRK